MAFDIKHDSNGKPVTMWSLIAHNTMPPTRLARYCCRWLKEDSAKGRITVTGVRWEESHRRKKNHGIINITGKIAQRRYRQAGGDVHTDTANKRLIMNLDNDTERRVVEQCYRTHRTMLNPIIDWSDEEVWEYLNDVKHVEHCQLYDEGFRRTGCIGCPMQPVALREASFERWPAYKRNYIKAFERMIANNKIKEDANLKKKSDRAVDGFDVNSTGEEIFEWWIRGERYAHKKKKAK